MFRVRKAGLDRISDTKEAYLNAGLSPNQRIELCDIASALGIAGWPKARLIGRSGSS